MIDYIKNLCVCDIHKAWTWFSMQATALNITFLASWLALPTEFKSAIPPWLMALIAIFLLFASMVGRVIKQDEIK